MSNKIVLAKNTFNALAETDPNKLIYSSDYNTLKYYLSGNTSITISGDGSDKITTTEITHSLGYKPFFVAYVNFFTQGSPTNLQYSIVPHYQNTLTTIRQAQAWVDSTKLYLQLRNKSSSSYTAVFYYKIFKNNLNL